MVLLAPEMSMTNPYFLRPDSDSSESDEVVRAPSRGPRLSDSEEEEYPDQKHRRHPPQRLPTAGGKNRRVGAASVEVRILQRPSS